MKIYLNRLYVLSYFTLFLTLKVSNSFAQVDYPSQLNGDKSLYDYAKKIGMEFDTTYYSNGKIKSIYRKIHGLKDGKEQVFTESGLIWKIFDYKNDSLNGYFVEYDIRYGFMSKYGSYKNGLPDGKWEYYGPGKMVLNKTEIYEKGVLTKTY